ncbi:MULTISPECIES: glycosyl hydrolase family 18 protein [unclassified Arthrobacter]|uniref:glycosyl hydrolase family 18 protein n=1 Tax=unclassified Arthrobacter TaxID=235627 RepID=UPI0014909FF0|nr:MULTISPECIES: glycosyl hydrolase family 18 protein [unclassified Arthrobacter]MBE0008895.1 chitinase [Arthrobacter sp. AET 35A]NOJ62625.1 chitinase [Arthrobacter sp. 147(2020)]
MKRVRPRRSLRIVALAVVALLGISGIAGCSFEGSPEGYSPDDADTAPALINGYRTVGYFPQWGVYGRQYTMKNLQDSGAAGNLSHINYAFGNIHHETLTCFQANKAQESGPNGSDGASDAWADYGMAYDAATSIAGTPDTAEQPLAGSFNQLRQLKAANPGLRAVISLGGWTWSKNFSRAAATDESRKALVSSCIDLYIKGNLPVIEGRGGDGAAAGLFDGIDIDWEWPGTDKGLEGNGVDTENDAENFRLLLQEFRKQLDAYASTTGASYSLSAFLPANPVVIEAGGWNDPALFEYLDFGNIQGYDLWGTWEPGLTGHQANLFDDPDDPREDGERFSVDRTVSAYLDAGIDPAQLGLGLAAFGRGWVGADSADPWGAATGAAPGGEEPGLEDYDELLEVGEEFTDSTLGTAWRFDGDQWWSYDNPETVRLKSDYILERGLGGGMWWDLAGNRDGSLFAVLSDELLNAPGGPARDRVMPEPTAQPPSPTSTLGTPTEAQDQAAQGAPAPGTEPDSAPSLSADEASDLPPVPWDENEVYTEGRRVVFEDRVYRTQWWTQGDVPGAEQWGPWRQSGD